MDELTWELRGIRRRLPLDDWRSFVELARAHPLCSIVHECPFTNWSFSKPRGYPGDAALLDFIYREPESEFGKTAITELGQNIFARNVNVPSCRAVRYRKDLLVDYVSKKTIKVLSVACGHLREMREVTRNHGLGAHITAFDQDGVSLAEVRRTLPGDRVTTIQGSIRQIVAGKFEPAAFDLIYAAGLYDYLSTPLAQRLTQILFEKLRPSGRLLFANFTTDTEDVGYMETYKDWWLTFRDEADMLEIISSVPKERASELRLFRDPDRHLVFAEMRRCD